MHTSRNLACLYTACWEEGGQSDLPFARELNKHGEQELRGGGLKRGPSPPGAPGGRGGEKDRLDKEGRMEVAGEAGEGRQRNESKCCKHIKQMCSQHSGCLNLRSRCPDSNN